jgi:hypothetical protein
MVLWHSLEATHAVEITTAAILVLEWMLHAYKRLYLPHNQIKKEYLEENWLNLILLLSQTLLYIIGMLISYRLRSSLITRIILIIFYVWDWILAIFSLRDIPEEVQRYGAAIRVS